MHNHDMSTDYGLAFRVFRAAKDWNQHVVAKRLGVGRSMMSLIESGKRQPSVEVVELAAKAFGVPQSMFVALATRQTDAVAAPLLQAIVRKGR